MARPPSWTPAFAGEQQVRAPNPPSPIEKRQGRKWIRVAKNRINLLYRASAVLLGPIKRAISAAEGALLASLELIDVRKSYGQTEVLAGISLAMEAKEF